MPRKRRGSHRNEAALETSACRMMRAAGLDPRKQNVVNYRGRTDRLVLGLGAFVAFVEFKMPGNEPTPLQLIEHANLREMGFRVVVADSLADVREQVVDVYDRHLRRLEVER